MAINPRSAPYLNIIEDASRRYGVPSSILYGVAQQESGFNPQARSPAGAVGLTQFLPSTAREYGINPYDPAQSIYGTAQYLSRANQRYNNWGQAVGSYNMGIGGMDAVRAGRRSIPAETRNYIPAVLANAQKYDAAVNGGSSYFNGYGAPNQPSGGGYNLGFRTNQGLYQLVPTDDRDQQTYNDIMNLPPDEQEPAAAALAIFDKVKNKNSWVDSEAPKSVLASIMKTMETLGI